MLQVSLERGYQDKKHGRPSTETERQAGTLWSYKTRNKVHSPLAVADSVTDSRSIKRIAFQSYKNRAGKQRDCMSFLNRDSGDRIQGLYSGYVFSPF